MLFCLLMVPVPGNAIQATSDDTLRFVLRVDDIISRNQTFLPSSIRPFQDMAESRGALVSWAVMPARFLEANVNRNGQMSRDLLHSVANGHEVALHGWVHICSICGQSSHEMFCTAQNRARTASEQRKLITDGLKVLADSVGVRPTTFIPPGHVYDATTVAVMAEEGFDAITVGGQAGALSPEVFNIGTSEDFGWALTQENYVQRRTQALADVRRGMTSDGMYTLLLHDPFTRQGYLNGLLLTWTAEVLDSVKVAYGNRLKFVTIAEAAAHMRSVSTSIDRRETEVPAGITLRGNYPNPFNPTTVIRYAVDAPGEVRLRVFDVHGREVAMLASGAHAPGEYEVRFDGAGLSSGVYVYRLESVFGAVSRKMVLIR